MEVFLFKNMSLDVLHAVLIPYCVNEKWFTNPIQILNQHEFFEDFVCVLLMILLTKIKSLDVGTGAPQ